MEGKYHVPRLLLYVIIYSFSNVFFFLGAEVAVEEVVVVEEVADDFF